MIRPRRHPRHPRRRPARPHARARGGRARAARSTSTRRRRTARLSTSPRAHTVARLRGRGGPRRFAASVDAVTYEFENVPGATAAILGAHAPLRAQCPRARDDAGPADGEDLRRRTSALRPRPSRRSRARRTSSEALAAIGRPAVLKTRRFGYDGKGQVMIRPGVDAAAACARPRASAPASSKVSCPSSARFRWSPRAPPSGEFAAYDLCANTHRDHILDVTRVPAGVAAQTEQAGGSPSPARSPRRSTMSASSRSRCSWSGTRAANAWSSTRSPRASTIPGHWTIEGALTSQFEQHVRAVCGWPLGATAASGASRCATSSARMSDEWAALLAEPGAHLHLYGKAEARPGRKMGHVTRVFPETG